MVEVAPESPQELENEYVLERHDDSPVTDDYVRIARREKTLKKLLLKLSLHREMGEFMDDPSTRHLANEYPLLYLSFRAALKCPMVPTEKPKDAQKIDQLIESLPELRAYFKKATKRDLAIGLRDIFTNIWNLTLNTAMEIECGAVDDEAVADKEERKQMERDEFMESEISDSSEEEKQEKKAKKKAKKAKRKEKRKKNKGKKEEGIDEGGAGEDDSESSEKDPHEKSRALAASRAYRKQLMALVHNILVTLSAPGGTALLFESMRSARSPEDLPHIFKKAFVNLFAAVDEKVLESLKKKKGRDKIREMTEKMPASIMGAVFKAANPFRAITVVAPLFVKMKLPNGMTVVQSMLRTTAELPKTERRLVKYGKRLPAEAVNQLQNHVAEHYSEYSGIFLVDDKFLDDALNGVPLEDKLRKTAIKILRLEIRRRDKQELVDFAGTEIFRFLILEISPLLARPLMELYASINFGALIKQGMGNLERLLDAYERNCETEEEDAARQQAIDAEMTEIHEIFFKYIRGVICADKGLFQALLEYALESYVDPFVLDVDDLLKECSQPQLDALWLEIDEAAKHFERGGHFEALQKDEKMSSVSLLLPHFSQMVRENALPVVPEHESPLRKSQSTPVDLAAVMANDQTSEQSEAIDALALEEPAQQETSWLRRTFGKIGKTKK